MGMEFRENLLPQLKLVASDYHLDYKLVDAIIQVESAYKVLAMRFEPKSKSLVIPAKYARMNLVTEDTETTLQKFSWGLCQIMGSTARWLGFKGPLPLLLESNINFRWACEYLRRLEDEHVIVENVVASYNAGSVRRTPTGEFVNQYYVDKVLRIYRQ
jgi:soluble lytic murein transglycosylase-like protein